MSQLPSWCWWGSSYSPIKGARLQGWEELLAALQPWGEVPLPWSSPLPWQCVLPLWRGRYGDKWQWECGVDILLDPKVCCCGTIAQQGVRAGLLDLVGTALCCPEGSSIISRFEILIKQ